jgi:hypothetical protein
VFPPGATNRALAGPPSRRDLMGIARMVPYPAIRTYEGSRTLAGAVTAVSAALIDSALRPANEWSCCQLGPYARISNNAWPPNAPARD